MTVASKAGKWLEGRSVTVAQTYDAPRALVFEAWSKPEHFARWFGPDGFAVRDLVMDFRVGGRCDLVLVAPDGTRFPSEGSYLEVVPVERIAFASAALDGDGKLLFETETVATFLEENGKTMLTVTSTVRRVFTSPAAALWVGGAEPGWRQGLGRLAAFLRDISRR